MAPTLIGMKVVSVKKTRKISQDYYTYGEFRENAGFSSIGLALSGNRGKISEVRFKLSLLFLYYHPHLTRSCLGFML